MDYVAAEPIRVSAILRLPLIGLVAVPKGPVPRWGIGRRRPSTLLLWLAVGVTALCHVLARRFARLKAQQEMRRQLVSEAMQSVEGHKREVAEHLHDGPLQTLPAARLELDEARERNPDPALDMVYAALQGNRDRTALDRHRAAPAGFGPNWPHPGGARTVAAVRVPHRDRDGVEFDDQDGEY